MSDTPTTASELLAALAASDTAPEPTPPTEAPADTRNPYTGEEAPATAPEPLPVAPAPSWQHALTEQARAHDDARFRVASEAAFARLAPRPEPLRPLYPLVVAPANGDWGGWIALGGLTLAALAAGSVAGALLIGGAGSLILYAWERLEGRR